MYQFSDSDSVDSDEGIRYKTESIRNKKSTEKNEREKESYRHRERKRSRSRSRSRHHTERKKLKKRRRDSSPEDKSNRKTSRSKYRDSDRSDDRKHRKGKIKTKKEDTNHHEKEMEEKLSDERSNTIAISEECGTFGPSLPKKEDAINNKEEPVSLIEENSGNDPTKSAEEDKHNLAFGPALPPKTNTPSKSESSVGEQSKNGNTFGPQLPPHLTKTSGEETNIIGPVLPSHFITVSSLDDDISNDLNASGTQDNKESGSRSDLIGPALPPRLVKESEENVIGPTLPPCLPQEENVLHGENEEQSEDEDVYGPVPAGAHYSQAHVELEERALKMKMDQLDPKGNQQPVREEWMLTLPEAKAAKFGLGPRQFRSKAGPDLSDR